MDLDTILKIRWAKAINRRSLTQKMAHLILTTNEANVANRAITNGLNICNKHCCIKKIKREPTSCLKCQGWNHYAKDCTKDKDICGNCLENHRTNKCTTVTWKCHSCKTTDHASWDCTCPTYIKKTNEFNTRIPDNLLQYYPTTDSWTWTQGDKPISHQNSDIGLQPHNNLADYRPQQNTRWTDTYIPPNTIEKSLNRKMHVCYLGPLIVLAWNKGGAYIVAELDGSVFNRPAAAFRIIPYFACTHIGLPPLNELLDIFNCHLQELKDSDVSDPNEEAGDSFDEGSLDNTPQLWLK